MSTTLPNGTIADISPWTLLQTGPAWAVNLPSTWNLTGVSSGSIGMNIYTSTPLVNNGGYTLLKQSSGTVSIVSTFPAVIDFAVASSDITTVGLYYIKFFATISGLKYYTDYIPWLVQA
ncbi:MAG: hypothetical protein H0W02_10145 [Ktedonobacteraceae bacterium]|nr:hypothetical protein [Ktedonobacteraceae bacterium]